jgi:hypothetical protein
VPLAVIQTISPYWVHHRLTYTFRVAASSGLAITGLSLLSFDTSLTSLYIGLALIAVASAILQATVLGLSGFSNSAASLWACAGSGVGRIIGPLLYIAANSIGCEPTAGPGHTLGKGCLSSSSAQASSSRVVFAIFGFASVALLCIAFGFTSVPMDFNEARSFVLLLLRNIVCQSASPYFAVLATAITASSSLAIVHSE